MTQDRLFSDQELEEMGTQTVELVEQAIDKGEYGEAKKLAWRMCGEFSAMHDLYLEWMTDTLTFIYQRYGDQALYDALHKGVTAWTAPLVDIYKGKEAKHRARLLTSALRGHLQPVKVLEDDEKFTMMMQPCGSGARLVQRDKHGPPTHHAKVKKSQPMTFNREDFPIYCAHCYFTNIIPLEITGAPPFVVIPAETIGEQHCRFLIYKDPNANPRMHAIEGNKRSEK
jgi:hypothetical protein